MTHLTDTQRETLAASIYGAIGWSGCAGSRWDLVPESGRQKWLDMAEGLAPLFAADRAPYAEALARVEALANQWLPDQAFAIRAAAALAPETCTCRGTSYCTRCPAPATTPEDG